VRQPFQSLQYARRGVSHPCASVRECR
jgi:hypothetical protein